MTSSSGLSPSALPDGGRVDFGALRQDRRRRLAEAMEEAGLDALVLGRPANVAFASGARQLWTAGSRPFGPACIVAAGAVSLLSVWDEGVPEEIPTSRLFGLSWNPATIARSLAAVPGLADAAVVGTDGCTPGFSALLSRIAPGASDVDAGPALRRARSPKSDAELVCIATAAAAAEAALSEMVHALVPGVTERHLTGVYLGAIARLGMPTPVSEGVACAFDPASPPVRREVATDRPVRAGELVALGPSAIYAGYGAGLARTWVVGGSPTPAQRDLAARCRRLLDALVAACIPGTRGAELDAIWDAFGEAAPARPFVTGMGMGEELPLLGAGADGVLDAGTVVTVDAYAAEPGVGGFLERETVLVGAAGPEVLSRYGRGPAGG